MAEGTSAMRLRPRRAPSRARSQRADWRFLLPAPLGGAFEHLVLLGGSTEVEERLLAGGFARRVSRHLPAEPSADVVAVLHDARVPLAQATRCLLPGGVLYYEVDRWAVPHSWATTPERIQRQLLASGLTATGFYWVAPDFHHSRRFLPLDVPGVLDWYLSTLYLPGTPMLRLLGAGARRLRGEGAAAWVPCYAVTAQADPLCAQPPSVLSHPALPTSLHHPGVRPILLTSGYDGGSRTVMLPFAPGATQPELVLKIAAHDSVNGNTEREQLALADVRAHLSVSMRDTVPQPLGGFRYEGASVGVESCAPGQPLSVLLGDPQRPLTERVGDLRLAARWLATFHRQTEQSRAPWDAAAITRWVTHPLTAYHRTFGTLPGEERLFLATRQRAEALQGQPLPLVWQHYDFAPWNVYREGFQLTVIDWEVGREWAHARFGPAGCDLLYFIKYWLHLVRRLHTPGAELRGFYFLDAPGQGDPIADATHGALHQYLATLEVDPRFLPLLEVYTWVEQALHGAARRYALGDHLADARTGNRSVAYVGALARHIPELFAAPGGARS